MGEIGRVRGGLRRGGRGRTSERGERGTEGERKRERGREREEGGREEAGERCLKGRKEVKRIEAAVLFRSAFAPLLHSIHLSYIQGVRV